MNILKPHVLLAAALAAGMCCSARADEGLTDAQLAVATSSPAPISRARSCA